MTKQEPKTFEELLEFLKRARGFDFSGYKPNSLQRRIERRMQQIPVATFEDYRDYLEVHPEEFSQLFNTILINVTDFFRDPPSWEFLQQEIIPQIVSTKPNGDSIRVWSAGSASGQEAYTLAMVLCEVMGHDAFRERVKIYATDADEEALAQARIATYPTREMEAVPEPLREKYFEHSNGRFTFRSDLRRCVIFGRHDLVQDAPISRLDLLVCRNALMYFNSETQSRILLRLHFALNEAGFLFLGRSEMMMTRSSLFAPVNLKYRVFSKVNNGNLRDRLLELAPLGDTDGGNQLARQIRIREMAIDATPLAQIVVDTAGVLVMVNERARTTFGLSLKDIGRPLQDLEISYRPVELRSLIEQSYSERRAIGLADVQRHTPKGETQYLDLQVVPLHSNGDAVLGAIVSFVDVSPAHHLQEELRRTAQDLETAYEELQSANEELETTNEELQSANEELETTNEELQSSNEELETLNEELQSSNEELRTVNDELRQRTHEFNKINAWLQSVLSIPPAALVVVDKDLNVILWNQRAEEMWGLRADEVRGKSFFAMDIGLPVDALRAPIREMMEERAQAKTLVLDAVNRRGKRLKCHIALTTFHNASPQEAGVALLMDDGTAQARGNAAVET